MNTATALPPADIDPVILHEAAGWLVMLQAGEASDGDLARLARWRERSAAHEAAWQRAQGMLDTFRQVPPRLGRDTLSRLRAPGRRHALRLGLIAMALPATWLAWRQTPWQEWTADLRTGVGDRRSVELADGTRLVLNTASAVNLAFDASERRVNLLAGEILMTTGRDPSPVARPFSVHTAQGRLRALGTRFSVRRHEDDDSTQLAVFEGAVEVRPARSDRALVVRAGEQLRFTAREMDAVQLVDDSATLWEQGMLLARDMPLAELVAELGRHHHGVLRCDPAVAALSVSGAFPLGNVEASLALLEQTLPVRIGRTTPFWVVVQAR
jgi:transmembrane sensor